MLRVLDPPELGNNRLGRASCRPKPSARVRCLHPPGPFHLRGTHLAECRWRGHFPTHRSGSDHPTFLWHTLLGFCFRGGGRRCPQCQGLEVLYGAGSPHPWRSRSLGFHVFSGETTEILRSVLRQQRRPLEYGLYRMVPGNDNLCVLRKQIQPRPLRTRMLSRFFSPIISSFSLGILFFVLSL